MRSKRHPNITNFMSDFTSGIYHQLLSNNYSCTLISDVLSTCPFATEVIPSLDQCINDIHLLHSLKSSHRLLKTKYLNSE